MVLPLTLLLNSQEGQPKKGTTKQDSTKVDLVERLPDTLAVKQTEVQKKIDKLHKEKKKWDCCWGENI